MAFGDARAPAQLRTWPRSRFRRMPFDVYLQSGRARALLLTGRPSGLRQRRHNFTKT